MTKRRARGSRRVARWESSVGTSVARDAARWRVLMSILAGGFALRSLLLRVKRVFVFAEHAGFDEDVVEEFPEVRDEWLPLLGRLRT